MFGIEPKVARAIWTAFLVSLTLYLAYLAASTISIFVVSLFLAHLLRPAVSFLDDLSPKRIPRSISIFVIYVSIVGLLSVAGTLIFSAVGSQAKVFAEQLPEILKNDPVKSIPIPDVLQSYRPQIQVALRRELDDLQKNLLPLVQQALVQILGHVGNLFSLVLVPILAFFFLVDNGEMFKWLANLATTARGKEIASDVLADLQGLLTKYMAALVGLACSTFVTSWIVFEVLGVPYAVLLAGLGGCLEVIPLVGPMIAGIATMGLAATAGYMHLAWILIFLVVFRLIQDYVISPRLMGHGVELHPLAVIFGVLAGEQIGGALGMFFAIPVLAGLRIIFAAYQRGEKRRSLVETPHDSDPTPLMPQTSELHSSAS